MQKATVWSCASITQVTLHNWKSNNFNEKVIASFAARRHNVIVRVVTFATEFFGVGSSTQNVHCAFLSGAVVIVVVV